MAPIAAPQETLLALSPQDVHLWFTPCDESAETLAVSAGVITSAERTRIDGLVLPRHRREQLVTRAFVRWTLSRYADLAPAEWRFACGPHGKPEVAEGLPRLSFSLSHSGGMVACAVALRRIGCDVEAIDTGRATPEVAALCFTPGERDAMDGLPESEWTRRFFRLWTLKEAYLKARGVGLHLPIEQVHISFDPSDAPSLEVGDDLADDGPGWDLLEYRPDPHHIASLAVERNPDRGLQVVAIPAQPWLDHLTSS